MSRGLPPSARPACPVSQKALAWRFGMLWGSVELEAEGAEWVEALPAAEFGRAEFYIDLLAERGPLLDQPYTRQLRGKLREVRFYLGTRGDAVRLSYFIATASDYSADGVSEAAPARAGRDRTGRQGNATLH